MRIYLLAPVALLLASCLSHTAQIKTKAAVASATAATILTDQAKIDQSARQLKTASEEVQSGAETVEDAADALYDLGRASTEPPLAPAHKEVVDAVVDDLTYVEMQLSRAANDIWDGADRIEYRAADATAAAEKVQQAAEEILEHADNVVDKEHPIKKFFSSLFSFKFSFWLVLILLVIFYPTIAPFLSILQSFGFGLSSMLRSRAEHLVAHEDDENSLEELRVLNETPKGRAAIKYAKRRAAKRVQRIEY